MSKPLILIGTGGMAREVRWIIEEINKEVKRWHILGWVSNESEGEMMAGLPILGDDNWLLDYGEPVDVVVSVGEGELRGEISKRLKQNPNISFPTIIAPSAEVSPYIKLGEGSIIMNKSLLTVDIEAGDFLLCNYGCSIGHDCKICDYVTINPGARVSGAVVIGEKSTVGAGATIIQNINIGSNVMIGAGATVIRDVKSEYTVVGVPAKPIIK